MEPRLGRSAEPTTGSCASNCNDSNDYNMNNAVTITITDSNNDITLKNVERSKRKHQRRWM